MKTVLDTNVFISGVFFKGPPYQILKVSGYKGIKVLKPRKFVDENLDKT